MDIGLSARADIAALGPCLSRRMRHARIRVCVHNDTSQHDTEDVLVLVLETRSEFPIGLDVVVSLQDDTQFLFWIRGVARAISLDLACQSICDGTGLGDDNSPYWSVVWDRGEPYLADDCRSAFADGEGGPVTIVRPLRQVHAADDASLDALVAKRSR